VKRRELLTLGAITLSVPGFVARGFAQDTSEDRELADLSAAYREAVRSGRPLLAIIVPTLPDRHYLRPQTLGAILDGDNAELLALLSIAELVCVSLATLRRIVPQVGAGNPGLVLVEADRVPAIVERVDEEIVPVEAFRSVEQDVAWLVRGVEHLLARDDAMIARRVGVTRGRAGDLREIEEAVANRTLTTAQAARAPSLVFAAYRSDPRRTDLRDRLVELARMRWVDGTMPGGEWYFPMPCGYCGMARTSERGRIFVFHYSRF
jgi:hypothetical protein